MNYAYRIPNEQVDFRGCKQAEPLRFFLTSRTVEAFVPSATPRDTLPLALLVGFTDPKKPYNGSPAWTVPFKTCELEPAAVRKQKLATRSINVGKLIIQTDSFRVGIEQALLEWVGGSFRVSVQHHPKGWMMSNEAKWRIELLFGDKVISQWDRSIAEAKLPFFLPTGNPV
ncbi:hypothetical protein EDM68_03650 [Candidatus Uhrbacteria bacterium]|nr:MAG: hypothetical protein EDM68_03650 [Candidatus Uhrbacteria bacterium]